MSNHILNKAILQEIINAIKSLQGLKIQTFPLNKDKIPLVRKWNERKFSIKEHNIKDFAGIGTCPGQWPIPIMIFDIDGPEGRKSWKNCINKYGVLPPTFTVKTGRVDGGEHFYFRIPSDLFVKSTASKFASKIDLRGKRGQVVLPPTVHKTGTQYQWHFDGKKCDLLNPKKIPMLPERWIQALNDTGNIKHPEKNNNLRETKNFSNKDNYYAVKALADEITNVIQSKEGFRNDALNTAAFKLGTLVGAGELSRSFVELTLTKEALSTGLSETEIYKTLKSGLDAGEKKPRIESGCDTYDTIKNVVSHGKANNTNGHTTYDTCDRSFKDIKTLSLPEPPLDSFHTTVKEAILNISRCKQCPVEVPLSALIALAAGLVGRSRQIRIKGGWSEPGNYFLGLVAPSATGKSPGQSVIFRPVYDIEKITQDTYKKAMNEYELDLSSWKKTKNTNTPMPQPPQRKDIILDDWTIESVSDSLLSNPKGLLLTRDELSGLFMDLDKYSGEKGSTKTKLMTAYDAKTPWKITRVNSNRNGHVPNPCISIYGGIQPAVVCKIFSDQDRFSGFLGRFDFIQAVQKKPATFTIEEETKKTNQTIRDLSNGLDKLSLTPGGDSKYIEVSDKAKKLFIKWHDDLAYESWHSSDETETGLLSKIRARGLRICLLLHCMEACLEKKSEMVAISYDTMWKALKLMDWLRKHTQATWLMLKHEVQTPTGQEMRVAQAIISIQAQIKNGWLPTKAISKQVNQAQDKCFHISPDTTGKICTKLGLVKKATSSARGFLITPDDIINLINLLPSKQVSYVSHVSQPNKTKHLKSGTK